jgi:adenylate cyclase
MWQLMVSAPEKDTKVVELKPGKLTLGRATTNDIVIDDTAASRQHAEILFDSATNIVSLIDLNSTNGTYVNRQRVKGNCQLGPNDLVRIGQVVMQVNRYTNEKVDRPSAAGTHAYTRALVLEAIDEHSIILYDVARRLNTVLDTPHAIDEVKSILKRALVLDYCEVVLADKLLKIDTSQLVHPMAKKAIHDKTVEVTSRIMFVPVMGGEQVLGLMIMQKTRPDRRPFDKRDLQLAIAISHQTALTLQRMELLEKMKREENTRHLLLRFVSPTEAEFLLKDYLSSGKLPELSEQKITVLFSDIANSTNLAEHLGARHFAGILTNFYDTAADIIFKHEGMIKYLGDGILAIFRHQDGKNTEQEAVLAGRELLACLKHTGSLAPDQRIVVGVAIHTGDAMVGYVGTKGRPEFNVIGDTVNVAFRLQEYARPYKIIIGPVTAAAVSEVFKCHQVGAVNLRGREQAIQAYEVLA